MKRFLRFSAILCLFFTALYAVISFYAAETSNYPSLLIVGALNLFCIVVLILETEARPDSHDGITKIAQNLGLEHRFQSAAILLNTVVNEVQRKNEAFSINVLEQKIAGKEQLSNTLERIVNLAYKLFDAESVELALFDRDINLYHSSIVIGTPMRTSSQAMLSGAVEGEELAARPDVLIQPLLFAGDILGTLRVALKKGVAPRQIDKDIVNLLGMQASLALINSQYTGELIKMRAASEETLKAKTGFLANLSHEIRAPLGIMLNAVELVLDGLCGPIAPDQAETLQMVHKNGEHLLELINDVLDYAKVESGRLQPTKVDILVGELLEDVCSVVRTQADQKSHRLICKPAEEGLAMNCDRRHARQIMINVLTNAIKYTPDGGLIEVWAERSANNKLQLHVKDNGVGISEEDREKVFAPFERLDNSYSISQVGTGIGMSLTKRLVEVNGGAINFTSNPNAGSDFWISFPAVVLTAAPEKEVAPELNVSRGKGEVLLLVEQDAGERGMVAKYLSHQGYTVCAASGKLEALEIFKTRKVELAIIDNKAADNSKDDVIKGIRETAQGKSLPIVLVSSRGFVFDIERYLKAGIDRCLIKPLKLAELGRICRQLLDGTFEGAVVEEDVKAELSPESAAKPKSDTNREAFKTRVFTVEDFRR